MTIPRAFFWSLVFLSTSVVAWGATWPPGEAPITLGEPPPSIGGGTLWNGRDLEGWTVFLKDPAVDPKTVWSVSDGVLHLAGKPNGYLKTTKAYGNYRLHVEWRWPAETPAGARSGIFVHQHGADSLWPLGVEIQLKVGKAGELFGLNGELPDVPLVRGNKRDTRPHASSEKPIGEWNACDIFCYHQIVEVWVNSVVQSQTDGVTFGSDPVAPVVNGRPATIYLRGAIGLQAEGYPIDFRNIWLDPLF